jgi:hypothetical protein
MWSRLLPVAAIVLVGCATMDEPAAVITDIVGSGPCGRLYVNRCRIGHNRNGGTVLGPCAVELRLVDFQGPVSACFTKEQLAAMDSLTRLRDPPAPPPSTGLLGVMSFPRGATIQVDGREAGVSPVLMRDMAPGSHTVYAIWPDGTTAQVEQELAAGRSATVRVWKP